MRDAFTDLRERPNVLLTRDYTDGHKNMTYEGFVCSIGPCDNMALTARVYVPVLNQVYNVRTLQGSYSSGSGIGKQSSLALGNKVAIEFVYGSSNLPKIVATIPNTRGLAQKVVRGETLKPDMELNGQVVSPPPVVLVPEAILTGYFGDVTVDPINFVS
jgi:hypothetical protein